MAAQFTTIGHSNRSLDEFVDMLREARVDLLIDDIVGSDPAEGVERIVVPGMFEAERRAARLADGVPLPSPLVDDLDAVATELGAPTLRLRGDPT